LLAELYRSAAAAEVVAAAEEAEEVEQEEVLWAGEETCMPLRRSL